MLGRPAAQSLNRSARTRRTRLWRRRPLAAAAVVSATALFSAGLVGLSTSSSSAGVLSIPATFFTVVDQDGANDVPAQSDLTQMGRDESSSTRYSIFWSWDSTDQWSGSGQTGDACALFDYNRNGNIDAVVCGQVTNPDGGVGTVVQNHAPYVFRCVDSRNDRCAQPSAPRSYAATDLAAGPVGAPVGTSSGGAFDQSDLVTPTDPFSNSAANGPGSNYPDDASLQVDVTRSYLNGLAGNLGPKYGAISSPDPTLVNVCSYPSAGNGGNNNPFDCITAPGSGFLKIVKNSGTTTGTFDFTISPVPTGSTHGTKQITTTGTPATGSVSGIALLAGSTRTVAEATQTGWELTAAACALSDGTSTGTRNGYSVSGIVLQSGEETTCTFTNARSTGSILVKKVDSSGAALPGATFTYTPPGGSATSLPLLTGQTAYFCQDGLAAGSYTLSETPPGGYTGAADSSVVVSADGSTCATRALSTATVVSNSLTPGSVSLIKKDDGGNALVGVGFTLYNDLTPVGTYESTDTVAKAEQLTQAGGALTFQQVTANRNYCVVETAGAGANYTTAAPRCFFFPASTTSSAPSYTVPTDIINPRQHKIIVFVCHQGTDTLTTADVTIDNVVKSTIALPADLPAGVSESALCGMTTGAAYAGNGHATKAASIEIKP